MDKGTLATPERISPRLTIALGRQIEVLITLLLLADNYSDEYPLTEYDQAVLQTAVEWLENLK